ncbi:MAG: phage tail sheath family protein [bacterium]|nr:phage tail sheath family protein [bacterium]
MPTYKTPGVYVEEISTLPPSVAEVSTAVPAFIGYTEKGPEIARINTLLEYEELFGGAHPSRFSVDLAEDADGVKSVGTLTRDATQTQFLMYYCLTHYFKNGGGSCYVVSIGDYSSPPAKTDFETGLARLEKEDEPTLILLTDAVRLAAVDYHSLCQQALAQCNKLGDRFAILDVKQNGSDDVQTFRDGIGTNDLMYGAAYYPYLRTSLNYQYQEDEVTLTGAAADAGTVTWEKTFDADGILARYQGAEGDAPQVRIYAGTAGAGVSFEIAATVLTIRNVSGETGTSVVAAWTTWKADAANDAAGFDVLVDGDGSGTVNYTSANVDLDRQTPAGGGTTLAGVKSTETALYNQIKTALTGERIVMPPSAAMAGIYARTDRERGVWKAPANLSVSGVVGPIVKITHDDQENLNVDATGGKSINAIRAFTGKGTLVWGARTLAGNDNEWRYVSVRRFFNMIEESSRKATAFAVFEPNDMTTWLKVKGMIENYLYGLWEQGALAGPTPEAAYFVNVGLGKTMTAQDVLEGRMIVEIGVAAVRPAEFIILRFTHKLQEA